MKITISKSQWEGIGKVAGWMKKKAQEEYDEFNAPESDYDDLGELGKQESFEHSRGEIEEEMDSDEMGNPPFFVSTYEIERAYGGTEEGGWWYDAASYVSTDKTFNDLDQAIAYASKLNAQYQGENDDLGSASGFETLPEGTEDSDIPRGFSGSARALRAVVEKVKGENDIRKKGRPHYE